MNVYDFDKTICKGDSESAFFYYELFHHPINLVRIPYYLISYIKYKLKKISVEEYRHRAYLTLKNLKDINKEVDKFWMKRKKKMLSWYFAKQKDDDVIISMSPRFLLERFLLSIGIKNFILSEYDLKTRTCIGSLNYGEEKLRRFKLEYNEDIDEFYSDSLLDLPLLMAAKDPYIVVKYVPKKFDKIQYLD